MLKSVTNNQPIQQDQLFTTIVQIIGTINSRALTSISEDIDNLTVLKPNHFISGWCLNAQGILDINKKDIDSLCKQNVLQSLFNMYWKLFIKK